MRTSLLRSLATVVLVLACSAGLSAQKRAARLGPGTYATFHTSQGDFTAQLYPRQAPKSVANFLALATGQQAYQNPSTGGLSMAPYYNGLLFFRTIAGFMIQTGDQSNNGTGRLGYAIPVEKNGLKFDQPGRMALAQAPGDPSTRGAQIFFTARAAPPLDHDGFLIIGQVVRGLDVVKALSEGPRKNGRPDVPERPPILQSVTIETVK